SQVPEDLDKAAQTFLGKRQDEISKFVSNILQGHLRSIIGKMDIDEILRERDKFNTRVVQESAPELKRVGIEIINLVIKDVNDNLGYIDSLGIANAARQQILKVAEAERDAAAAEAQIQVQEKEGQRKTAELQATQVAKASADKQTAILTAEAQKETAILQADAQAETLRRTAEAKKNAATLE